MMKLKFFFSVLPWSVIYIALSLAGIIAAAIALPPGKNLNQTQGEMNLQLVIMALAGLILAVILFFLLRSFYRFFISDQFPNKLRNGLFYFSFLLDLFLIYYWSIA